MQGTMTSLEYVTQVCEVLLALLLMARLTSIRGEPVFVALGLSVAVDLLGSAIWLLSCCSSIQIPYFDYRVFYGFHRILAQLLIFATIYLLLRWILRPYPGLLRWGSYAIKITFIVAVAIGLASSAWESAKSSLLASATTWQSSFMYDAMLGERAASSAAVLWIVGMLLFLLWMPVSIARNAAVLTASLAALSVGITLLFLVQSLVLQRLSRDISAISMLWTGLCFGYCAAYLRPVGQQIKVVMSQRKSPEEQRRLLQGLERLNAALLRGANREA